MKAAWKATNSEIVVEKIKNLGGGNNLCTAEYPALIPRPGRALYGRSMNSSRHPQQLLTLSTGTLACSYKYNEVPGVLRIFDMDESEVIGEAFNFAPFSAHMELKSETDQMRATVFGVDNHTSIVIFENGSGDVVEVFGQKNYMTMHKGSIVTSGYDENFVHYYPPGDYHYSAEKSRFFIINGRKPNCRGLASYKSYLVYWSEECMYQIIDGVNPSTFLIADDIGCISGYTIVNMRGKLIWLDRDGVYEWGGGMKPQVISGAVAKYVTGLKLSDLVLPPQAIAYGDIYYLTLVPYNGTPVILTFDTVHRIWNVETGLAILSFTTLDGKLVGITPDCTVWTLSGGASEEVVEWSWLSPPLEPALKVIVHVEMPHTGAVLRCMAVCDDDEKDAEEITKPPIGGKWVVPMPVEKVGICSKFQVKLEGEGRVLIKGVETVRRAAKA
ncbi:MAG: hypothetical protein LBL34_01050 [Clostridiales bacterium]|jgi:hypothetical protein|nr:hypothetical protein [Clostridiales bacterium]